MLEEATLLEVAELQEILEIVVVPRALQAVVEHCLPEAQLLLHIQVVQFHQLLAPAIKVDLARAAQLLKAAAVVVVVITAVVVVHVRVDNKMAEVVAVPVMSLLQASKLSLQQMGVMELRDTYIRVAIPALNIN